FDAIGDLLLQGGLVVGREAHRIGPPPDTVVLDASRLIVTPGFIDLHTHLRFPGFPEKETIESGTRAAAAGGFTTVCAMANTNPVVDSVETLQLVLDTAEREASVRVLQLGAISHGLEGRRLNDLTALADAGAIAFSDDGKPVWDAGIMRQALMM